MTIELVLDPATALGTSVLAALADNRSITLTVTPARAETVYEVGDRVRVEADDGMIPAVITHVGPEYIRVKYGPLEQFTTSLARHGVRTNRLREHPQRVEIAS